MDFGELSSDTDFIEKFNKTTETLDNIEDFIKKVSSYPNYDSLTVEEKVKCDLFSLYSINSLFWIYLKLQGKDISSHNIKNELSRVRQVMMREKDLHERNTIRPRLDVDAAKRFVRHELWTPKPKAVKPDQEAELKNQTDNDNKNVEDTRYNVFHKSSKKSMTPQEKHRKRKFYD